MLDQLFTVYIQVQVLVNYGRYGNDILAETFGFTVEDNPYDQVSLFEQNQLPWMH